MNRTFAIAASAGIAALALTSTPANAAPATPPGTTVTLQPGQAVSIDTAGQVTALPADTYVPDFCDGNAYDRNGNWVSSGIQSATTWDYGPYGVRPTNMSIQNAAGRVITINVDRWEDSSGYAERGPGGNLATGATGDRWSANGFRSASSSVWEVHFYLTTRTSVGGGTNMHPGGSC